MSKSDPKTLFCIAYQSFLKAASSETVAMTVTILQKELSLFPRCFSFHIFKVYLRLLFFIQEYLDFDMNFHFLLQNYYVKDGMRNFFLVMKMSSSAVISSLSMPYISVTRYGSLNRSAKQKEKDQS